MKLNKHYALCAAAILLASCGQEEPAPAPEAKPEPAVQGQATTADTTAPAEEAATSEETTDAGADSEDSVGTRGMKVKKSDNVQAAEEAEEPAASPEERYNNGEGAPADAKQAISWYKEFAEAGIADAQYKLAECYFNTRSEPLNFVKAVEQYRAAAEQGNADACRKLAECYKLGLGVEANEEEAAKWESAAQGGSAE